MLPRGRVELKLSLSVQFGIWIVGGFAALTILAYITGHFVCSAEPSTRLLAAACDAKITDLALVYFTYCLVIVGWFGIRSNQITVEDLERAYLWPGFGENEMAPIGRRWFLTVHNTGRSAGVIQVVHHALVSEEDYQAGRFTYEFFDGRENVIPPAYGPPIQERVGVVYEIDRPMVSCGWIEYQDIFGHIRRRGWKHRLNLTHNFAGNISDSLPGCYSSTYKPWEIK